MLARVLILMVLSERCFLPQKRRRNRVQITCYRPQSSYWGVFSQRCLHGCRNSATSEFAVPLAAMGLIAKLICDFSKAAGHNSPIAAYFLDHVPESSLRKSEFPTTGMHRHGGGVVFGEGSFHKMSHKIPESLLLFIFF